MSTQNAEKQAPAMTRKEALAVVNEVIARVSWHLYDQHATEEDERLRKQISSALRTLAVTVHGKPEIGFMSSLCDVCYLQYAEVASPFITLKGSITSHSPCAACVERLQAEGKLECITNWATGEVIPC
ncbi:MAG: hypothetical protein H0V70_01585 [Ktedonobacteraceae bacterium]|nr:hypothetical protein [Ktedonobacteraceae bacterium]